jgi:hypothetical protein
MPAAATEAQRCANRSNYGIQSTNETSSCGCCGVNRSRPSLHYVAVEPPYRLEQWREDNPIQAGLVSPTRGLSELRVKDELLREKMSAGGSLSFH